MVKIWSMVMVIPQSWGIPYHGELTPLTPIVYGQMSIPFLWENKPCFDHGTRVENGLDMATGARQLKLGTAVSCLAPKPALSCRGHPDGTNMTDFVSEKVTLIMASLHKSESWEESMTVQQRQTSFERFYVKASGSKEGPQPVARNIPCKLTTLTHVHLRKVRTSSDTWERVDERWGGHQYCNSLLKVRFQLKVQHGLAPTLVHMPFPHRYRTECNVSSKVKKLARPKK